MGKLKQEAEHAQDYIRDRVHELAQEKWWTLESIIEDWKEELRDEIMAELEEWYPLENFQEVNAIDVLEVLDEECPEDMIDDAIYSEWDV